MGWDADVELAEMLVEELRARGLARPSEDGVSVPLHPTVRQTILVVLAQLARAAGHRSGPDLHPTTNEQMAVDALVATLALKPLPSAGHVVTLDLQSVAFDLASVPLDDVLDFREAHAPEYRQYMRNLRAFLARLAAIDEEPDRERAIIDRQEELADEAQRLQQELRRSVARPLAGFALGIAGSAWTIATQDPIGGALAAAGFIAAGIPRSSQQSAYSYLFAAERSLNPT